MRGENKNIAVVMVYRMCLFISLLPVGWMQGKTLKIGKS